MSERQVWYEVSQDLVDVAMGRKPADLVIKNGRNQTIYFFAKEPKDGALDAVPSGYKVSETKNGLPVLKKA